MKVDLKNTLNQSVEVILPCFDEKMLNKALLVSIRVSYMIHFDSISDDNELTTSQLESIHNLIGDLPISICDKGYISCRTNQHLLFLNRGHYVCFYNDDDFWGDEISKWKFQSNHDSCWRDDAYRDLEKKDQAIRMTMAKIKETIDGTKCTPNDITPNFSTFDRLKVIDLPIYKGSRGDSYSNYSEFTLTLSSEGNSLIADDRKEEKDK